MLHVELETVRFDVEHALGAFERDLRQALAHHHGGTDDRPAVITLTVQ